MNELDLWWLTPLLLALLIGLICPATGSLLITQRRILLANLMAHSMLPGLVLALAFNLDPTIGGLISGLIGALLAERLSQRFKGREEGAMNTVLAGFTALGVLLVPLLLHACSCEVVCAAVQVALGRCELHDLVRHATCSSAGAGLPAECEGRASSSCG